MAPPNLASVWDKLEAALLRLYDVGEPLGWFTPEQYMALYTLVYEYCIADGRAGHVQGRELYDALVAFYQTLLPGVAGRILASGEQAQIGVYLEWWRRYGAVARHVEGIFQYLDRFLIPRERDEGRPIPNVYPMLWHAWDVLVLQPAETAVLAWCAGWLQGERSAGMAVEFNAMVRDVVASYHAISMVPREALLADATPKAKVEAQPFAERLLPWYCAQLERDARLLLEMTGDRLPTIELAAVVAAWWAGEVARARHYLEGPSLSAAASEKRVKDTMKGRLLLPLLPRLGDLVQSGLADDEEPVEKVRAAYALVMLRKSLLSHLLPHVEGGFLARLRAKLPRTLAGARSEQQLMFVSMLFAMFQEGRRIVQAACGGSAEAMIGALDAALADFICDPAARTGQLGEFLARWVDRLLRDQAGLAAEHPAVAFVLVVLKMLEGSGREAFQHYAARLLARRLLARQAFFDRVAEEALLAPLAAVYGAAFVSHQRRMLADTEASMQMTQAFHGRQKRARLPFELSFQVLSSGSWPAAKEPPMPWDARLAECIESFGRHYGEQHSGRVLTWCPSLTTAEVSATLNGRTYSFIMSAPQHAVVAALAEQPLALADVLVRTKGMPESLVEGALPRLLQAGLISEATGTGMGAGTGIYQINPHFSSQHTRLNLSPAVETERPGEAVSPRDHVEDRTYMMQALLVRHLKRCGSCSVAELLALGEGADKALAVLAEKEYCSILDGTATYIP